MRCLHVRQHDMHGRLFDGVWDAEHAWDGHVGLSHVPYACLCLVLRLPGTAFLGGTVSMSWPISPFSAPRSCYNNTISYSMNAMTFSATAYDALTCQMQCQKQPNCNFFTFVVGQSMCNMYSSGSMVMAYPPDQYISGPRQCGTFLCSRVRCGVRVGLRVFCHLRFYSQAAECFIANVSFMNNTIAFSEYASDASDCHAKCKSFGEICAAFTYINEACTGFSSTSIPSMMLPGSISGANTCVLALFHHCCPVEFRFYSTAKDTLIGCFYAPQKLPAPNGIWRKRLKGKSVLFF